MFKSEGKVTPRQVMMDSDSSQASGRVGHNLRRGEQKALTQVLVSASDDYFL